MPKRKPTLFSKLINLQYQWFLLNSGLNHLKFSSNAMKLQVFFSGCFPLCVALNIHNSIHLNFSFQLRIPQMFFFFLINPTQNNFKSSRMKRKENFNKDLMKIIDNFCWSFNDETWEMFWSFWLIFCFFVNRIPHHYRRGIIACIHAEVKNNTEEGGEHASFVKNIDFASLSNRFVHFTATTCRKFPTIPTRFSSLKVSVEVDYCRSADTILSETERLVTKLIGYVVER